MMGASRNPVPGGANWTVLFGEVEDDDAADEDEEGPANGEVQVLAFSPGEEHDLPGVSEVEHRFSLMENSADEPLVVYVGVSLHRHGDDYEGDCERFTAADDEVDLDALPDDLEQILSEALGFEIYPPGDEPVDAEPVTREDMMDSGPDTDPGGMYQ